MTGLYERDENGRTIPHLQIPAGEMTGLYERDENKGISFYQFFFLNGEMTGLYERDENCWIISASVKLLW